MMQCLRLVRSVAANIPLAMPVRHKNKSLAAKLGVKRISKTNVNPRTYPKRAQMKGTIEVYRGMTYRQFGKLLNITTEQMLETAKMVDENLSNFTRKHLNLRITDASKFGPMARPHGLRVRVVKDPKELTKETEDLDEDPLPPADPAKCLPRPPVVTIMGHVDHGKTTLLDALRASRIVESEFGGITQHIGAFSVSLPSLKGHPRITFLDTPGHAAFSAMRQRGANCTDLVVLVVAADDGVMPQTLESVRFAASANVPILVAINKIDAPNADVERVTNELMYKAELLPESMGGDVQCVPISALKRQNLTALQEAIIAQAELMDLRADQASRAEAVVLEAQSEKGRGKVATCLVQRGGLKPGSVLVSGTAVCRVRAMFDETGRRVMKALPSDPVEVMGWSEVPETGDLVLEVKNEARANEVQRLRQSQLTLEKVERDAHAYKEAMDEYKLRYHEYLDLVKEWGNSPYARYAMKKQRPQRILAKTEEEEGRPGIYIILKADVVGSLEAIVDMIAQVQNSHLYDLEIIEGGVGPITDNEMEMAQAFNAVIYAFNVDVNRKTKTRAEELDLDIREFNVIYHLAHDLRDTIEAAIPPVLEDRVLGTASVIQMFKVSQDGSRRKGQAAGCICEEGVLRQDARFRVYRSAADDDAGEAGSAEDEDENETAEGSTERLIFDGLCESLYHKRQEMRTIKQDSECGVMLAPGPDGAPVALRPGDRIECYDLVEVRQDAGVEFSFD